MGGRKPALSDGEFARLYEEVGPAEMCRRAGLAGAASNISGQLKRVERALGRPLVPPKKCGNYAHRVSSIFPERVEYELKNGIFLVISDLHRWPGPLSLMQRAFIKFCKRFEPCLVNVNGDVIDLSALKRHPPINWERLPTVQEEIEAAQDYLHQIEMACGRGVPKIWNLGNHDEKFESTLAKIAPEYAKIKGVHLKDHFPQWVPAYSCWINDDIQILHNFKGGMHAPQNNVLWSGAHTITGHLHSSKLMPVTLARGKTLYGVDTGVGCDPYSPQFLYVRDRPRNWREGFGVFTIRDSRLMAPELVTAWDKDHVQFRGELIKV